MGKIRESIEFKSNYYAQAVFNVARAENMVDQVEDELRQLKDEVTNNLELKKNLTDPSIENYEKIKVLLEILGDDASKAIKSFAAMMVILDAIDSFEQTYKDFVELANQLKRQVSIEVISVIELDKEIENVNVLYGGKAAEAIATAEALRSEGLYRRAFQVLKDFTFEAELQE